MSNHGKDCDCSTCAALRRDLAWAQYAAHSAGPHQKAQAALRELHAVELEQVARATGWTKKTATGRLWRHLWQPCSPGYWCGVFVGAIGGFIVHVVYHISW